MKFDKILNLKITLNNNPTNILNNLCTGLETFLGFNSATKGYDGSGIVYSDLDRLSDGVMGFLYQVLKDVSEKQPYSVGKITLRNLVSSVIEHNLCSGHEGFKRLFTKLPESIAAYNRDVQEGNERVKGVINDMDRKMTALKNQVSSDLNDNAVADSGKTSTAAIEAWNLVRISLDNALIFENGMYESHNNVLDLNITLRDKVINGKNNVLHERGRLQKYSRKEKKDLEKMETKIREVLDELKMNVNDKIRNDVTSLVDILKFKVEDIKVKLEEINKRLWEYVKQLIQWIDEAKQFIDNLSETHVQPLVQNTIGTDKQEKLYDITTRIQDSYASANEHVKQLVKDALNAVKEMDGELKKDLYKVKTAVEREVKEIENRIGSLYINITGTPGPANEKNKKIEEIMKHIKGEVEGIKGLLGEPMKVPVTGGTYDSIYQNWDALKEQLTGDVEILTGTRVRDSSLTQLVNGVTEYVKEFSRDSFETLLTKWIAEIIEDGVVHGKLFVYVTDNFGKLSGLDRPAKLRNVKLVINQHLPKYMNTDINLAAQEKLKGAEITNIGEWLEQFANHVDVQLTKTLNSTIGKAAKTIEMQVKSGDQSHKPDLTDALKSIFQCVANRFKHVAAELRRFIEASKIKNVKDAIQQVKDIGTQFNGLDDTTIDDIDYGHKIDTALGAAHTQIKRLHGNLKQAFESGSTGASNFAKAVDDAIQQVKTTLEAEIGQSGAEKITKLPESKFSGYGSFVAQTTESINALTSGDIDKMGGSLVEVIKQLGYNGFDTFGNKLNGDESDPSNTIGFVDQIRQNLNALIAALMETGKHLNGNLHVFKMQTVAEKLKKIKDDLYGLHNDFNRVIQTTDVFIRSDADKSRTDTINRLQEYVNDNVGFALSTLTTAARRNYVSSIKSLLAAFADKITNELQPLPDLIDKDRKEGFKGFMRTLQGVMEDNGDTSNDNIEKLSNLVRELSQDNVNHKEAFRNLSEKFQKFFWPLKGYLKTEIDRLHKEEDKKKQLPETDDTVYTAKLGEINVSFNDLLSHLQETNRYDHQVHGKLDKLSQAVAMLKPETFDRPNSPVLDSVTRGLGGFVGELNKVYISAYDSQTLEKDLVDRKEVITTREATTKYELREYGRNCSKVFLHVLSILHTELNRLVKYCQSSTSSEQINKSTIVGMFFRDQGYDVSDFGEQNGELQDHKRMTVFFIYKRLFRDDDRHIFKDIKRNGSLQKLHDCLQTYYQVGHVATFAAKKRPCSIFEMLCWLSGLQCTAGYEAMLNDALSDLFIDPKQVTDGELSAVIGVEPVKAYPQAMEYDGTRAAIEHLCSTAYDLLVYILGTGNAHTMYASDFSNNSLGFHYPTSGEDCLGMLMDVLSRLLPPLQFMYSRCKLSVQHGGWQECEYGKNIRTTKWPCKEHITDEVACRPNDQPKCQPTSPLMSYLNDCLPGHLPHQLSSIGCKYDCATCPSTSRKGQPCITPLGFRGFSGSTKTGKDLCSILTKIIENKHLASLFCLVTKPPKTLPEHFGFALSLVADWHKGDIVGKKGVQNAFEDSTKELSIRLCDKPGDLTSALVDAYGSDSVKHSTCSNPHLRHLASNDFCNKHPCAPYLSSLYADCYKYIANKNAKLYLYWAVYLPWDFWTLLNNLYTAFCSIACQDWGCNSCMRADKCKKGKHGDEKSRCQCESIVTCNGVSPTLYQYGFIFNNAVELNRSKYQKTCNDFCNILSKVLKSDYFTKLFDKCDEFLWIIRSPFSYLVLTLWLLSLLYLIHIMVIRLDLLHIKSHLHSPSSHRIAAQSLLAAGRVGKLSKISYLQP
ncbi:hypothetical protein, conserved [Babesia bigemina]|uniref:C3H1-type domain-containing protein n=1 Tax=Babesia bigemina TaxID=5866 RepID=A0A061BQX1_BABBI|nr:hypothetical protein, conserved [Babesia bigemina]CDR71858.1 hypothetical protein, conserved [Babesia bigemina]|eukprot:XP_012770801.1 hypothetical protein, conserved [Babesia bigemina]